MKITISILLALLLSGCMSTSVSKPVFVTKRCPTQIVYTPEDACPDLAEVEDHRLRSYAKKRKGDAVQYDTCRDAFVIFHEDWDECPN